MKEICGKCNSYILIHSLSLEYKTLPTNCSKHLIDTKKPCYSIFSKMPALNNYFYVDCIYYKALFYSYRYIKFKRVIKKHKHSMNCGNNEQCSKSKVQKKNDPTNFFLFRVRNAEQ